MSTEDLLRQLEDQRAAFLALEQRVYNVLREKEAAKEGDGGPSSPVFSDGIGRQSTISFADPGRKSTGLASLIQTGSAMSVDSDDEDDETYYVRTPLPKTSLAEEDLRTHLRAYAWDSCGRTILEDVVTSDGALRYPVLFRKPHKHDRAHLSSYQVFDVGVDGTPLGVDEEAGEDDENAPSKAQLFWNMIKDVNLDPDHRPAVGRILIAQEPDPVAFVALHYAMKEHFDMDEIFVHLVNSEHSSATPHRPFAEDERQQRTFTFSFEYYTLIGEERQPMPWQSHDKRITSSNSHLPLTRCSSVVALSLLGEPIKKIRNNSRRKTSKPRQGLVYDPFAPWLVINVQAYPDWTGSAADTHDSTKHYVNGPEAFLATVLTEFKDARKRYEDIYKKITKMITPPPDFIFDEDQRDKRLFEDAEFTYTRGYFWAHQTLGSINDSIKAMIDAYEDTFTEEVWEGKHKSIWPLLDEALPRNDNFRRKLYMLRKEFEREVRYLHDQIKENNDRRIEIRDLRDQLFSGTSVLESRKSVELSEITILQGHNVKLLTLINIFFMPLTFVTSVFGMTNMPTEHSFWEFGTVMVTVCVPFFLLIGSLNTTKGYEFWKARCKEVFKSCVWFLAFISGLAPTRSRGNNKKLQETDSAADDRDNRTHFSCSRASSSSCGERRRMANDTDNEKDDSTEGSGENGRRKRRDWLGSSFLKKISRKSERKEDRAQEV